MAVVGTDIARAAQLLEAGALVAIPTETVYGLAALCTDEDAISAVYAAKGRPRANPLILHASSLEAALPWLATPPSAALKRLADCFWPGPLTLLLPAGARIHPQITAGGSRVALRVPAHAMLRDLLSRLSAPLVAPSANPSGYLSPSCSEHVCEQLGDRVAYVLEGGACSLGVESTIVGMEADKMRLYRAGALSTEDIEAVLGAPLLAPMGAKSGAPLEAPGRLKKHYAPHTPLHLWPSERLPPSFNGANERVGLLRFSSLQTGHPKAWQRVLSARGSLNEAARRLFSMLHELEEMNLSYILAETVPDEGLGRAINERLKRAATQRE